MSVLLHRVAFEDGLTIAQYESAQDDQMTFGTLGVRDGAPAVAAQAARPVTELLVQFRPGASAADQALAISNAGGSEASVIRSAADGDLLVIKVGGGRSAEAVMDALANNPNVAFTEANSAIAVQGSNDTRYTNGGLWGMYGDTTSPANQFGSQAGEPRRVCRRLQFLRRWSPYEQDDEQVCARGAGTRGADGAGSRAGSRVPLGGGGFDIGQDRLCGADAA